MEERTAVIYKEPKKVVLWTKSLGTDWVIAVLYGDTINISTSEESNPTRWLVTVSTGDYYRGHVFADYIQNGGY